MNRTRLLDYSLAELKSAPEWREVKQQAEMCWYGAWSRLPRLVQNIFLDELCKGCYGVHFYEVEEDGNE